LMVLAERVEQARQEATTFEPCHALYLPWIETTRQPLTGEELTCQVVDSTHMFPSETGPSWPEYRHPG
jgi:hypothetical protein